MIFLAAVSEKLTISLLTCSQFPPHFPVNCQRVFLCERSC